MSYHHLTLEERILLSQMRKESLSIRQIAQELERSPSTISRELKRNEKVGKHQNVYMPRRAERLYRGRIQQARAGKYAHTQLAGYVQEKLLLAWSPEQVAGRIRLDFPEDTTMRVSHTTIYRWLKKERLPRGEEARKRLRHSGKTYGDGRGKLLGVRELTERPKEVRQRTRFGDWEMDTIVSKEWGPCLLTLIERKSRYCGVMLLKERTKEEVRKALKQLFSTSRYPLQTITSDRGKEFFGWRDVEHDLQIQQYFTRPYSPWQKGCVENLNGLVRQFFPKKGTLKFVCEHHVRLVMLYLNHRPRKCLGFRSPHEVLLLT